MRVYWCPNDTLKYVVNADIPGASVCFDLGVQCDFCPGGSTIMSIHWGKGKYTCQYKGVARVHDIFSLIHYVDRADPEMICVKNTLTKEKIYVPRNPLPNELVP